MIGTTITIRCAANTYADVDISYTEWVMTCTSGNVWENPAALGQTTINCIPGVLSRANISCELLYRLRGRSSTQIGILPTGRTCGVSAGCFGGGRSAWTEA